MGRFKIITIKEAKYSGATNWFFHCGIEMGALLATFAVAIAANTARDIPLAGKYYVCPFKFMTGYSCASCGITRAFIAIGHGRLGEALHCNALAFALFPFLICRLSQRCSETFFGKYPTINIKYPNALLLAFILIYLAFGAGRFFLEITGHAQAL